MDRTVQNVHEFHDAFGIETPEQPSFPGADNDWAIGTLGQVSTKMGQMADALHRSAELGGKNVCLLRLQLIQEELGELAEAMALKDPVAALDALCDLRYVLDGTTLALGLHHAFPGAFAEVHRSNMSKLDADGNPVINEAGRVVKSDRYRPPELHHYLEGADATEAED
jgi:predicted HAD superfamily Cof-like phosphohydrolase